MDNLEIKVGEKVDTKKVETISGMFGRCKSLTSLDLSFFNTDNIL